MIRSKQLFFLGLLTVCLNIHVFAMVTQDEKAAGARKSSVYVEDNEFKDYFVMAPGGRKLIDAANRGHHEDVQKLCAQHTADGTINDVINIRWGNKILNLRRPVEWAIFRLNEYLNSETQSKFIARKDSRGKTIETLNDYLLTIKTLFEFGAIFSGKCGKGLAKFIHNKIVEAIDADGKIDREKISLVLGRLQDLPCSREIEV